MKILKEGKSDTKQKAVCQNCGCEFEYDFEDYEQESLDEWRMVSFVKCPWCNERVILEKYETPEEDRSEVFLPIYPDKFLFMSEENVVKLSDERLNEYTTKVYQKLKDNPDEDYYMIACGDSMIVGFNNEDGVNLYVCKNYEEAVWDKNEGWLTEE